MVMPVVNSVYRSSYLVLSRRCCVVNKVKSQHKRKQSQFAKMNLKNDLKTYLGLETHVSSPILNS